MLYRNLCTSVILQWNSYTVVLHSYCRADSKDKMFAPSETKRNKENYIEGGAVKPPFEVNLIERFREKVKKERDALNRTTGVPFCQLVINTTS